ncbi:MAG: Formate dehydrogenase, partial [Clostridia bacterium]|nr:Formate dehydrogenase [Clostridia bacterium]
GRKHIERMYSNMRIKQPMKKVDGEFVEITWDEALETITSKLKHYIDNYGTLSIAQYNDGGAGGMLKEVENLFFDYLGNVTLFKGSLCWGAGMAAQQSDFGGVKGHYPEDIYNTNTIIIWGRNPAETNLHLVPFIKKSREKGIKVVLIDPIKTATAAFSDWQIQLKPGGDATFALAAAKYMIEKKLYDKSFVYNNTKGFKEIKDYLDTLDYKQLLEACGSNIDSVKSFVELLTNKPTTIYIGYGVQRYNGGGATVRAIDMLGALAGNIGIAGGGVNYANKIYGDYINWDAVAPDLKPNHRYIVKAKLSRELAELDNPKVKAIFISRSNPVVQLPNTLESINALNKIEFKVVLDYFMTDTAKLADIILPVTYFMEETDIMYSSMWNGYMFYNEKLVDNYYQTKPEYQIYSLLAERMGIAAFPQMDEIQWIEKLLGGSAVSGISFEQLRKDTFITTKETKSIPWADYNFKTASGKFEFVEPFYLQKYIDNIQKDEVDYFQLLTVHARESLHSQHFMTSNATQPEVYICNADADYLDICDKELVMLKNQFGCIKAQIAISDKAQKGVLYMKEGWWLKNGGSVNRLTSNEVSDIGNQATYNECRCRIEKLGVVNE